MIHVPTAFFIFGAVAFLFAIKMAADGIGRGEASKVLIWWCVTFLCLAGASLIMALRPFDPVGGRSGLPSLLLLAGFGLAWRGVSTFAGTRAPWGLVVLGPLIWLAAWSQGVFADDGHRLILVSIVVIFYMTASGWTLITRGGGLRSARQAGMVCFFHAGVQVLRIITVLWLVSPTEPINMAGFPAILFVFEAVLMLVALGYLFLTLSRERGEQMLLAAAQTDFLTGVSNRRGFSSEAERLLAAADFPAREDVLLLCDLDHFKAVNDAYGHAFGDEVLTLFCRVAERHITKSDLLGRLGGEEFAILMRGNDRLTAARRADALRAEFEIAALGMPSKPQGITVSIGLSSTELGRDLADLLRRADNALYRAKARGRNRVVSSDGQTEGGPAVAAPSTEARAVQRQLESVRIP
jgi:diguanylate cyclase (GGDEF)-like protein